MINTYLITESNTNYSIINSVTNLVNNTITYYQLINYWLPIQLPTGD